MEGNYGTIDADVSTYHGYYIIRFSSSPYTLQADLSIYGQFISSGEMVCEGNYFSININSHYYVLHLKTNNKILSLGTIINGNAKVIFNYSNDIVPSYLRSISQKDFSTLSPLHVPMKEHDNIMDKNNHIKSIGFTISVLIGTQETTYD